MPSSPSKFSTTPAILFLAGSAAAALAALSFSGCAGTGAQAHRTTKDLRGSAVMGGHDPHLMMAGPARLLHVDVDGREPVSVYQVAAGEGGEADCRRRGASARARGAETLRELDVPRGQAICLEMGAGSARAARKVRVSWHAQQGPSEAAFLTARASRDNAKTR